MNDFRKIRDKNIIDSNACKSSIKKAISIMNKKGRLLIRKSGTEPKIRIMAESHDKNLIFFEFFVFKNLFNLFILFNER